MLSLPNQGLLSSAVRREDGFGGRRSTAGAVPCIQNSLQASLFVIDDGQQREPEGSLPPFEHVIAPPSETLCELQYSPLVNQDVLIGYGTSTGEAFLYGQSAPYMANSSTINIYSDPDTLLYHVNQNSQSIMVHDHGLGFIECTSATATYPRVVPESWTQNENFALTAASSGEWDMTATEQQEVRTEYAQDRIADELFVPDINQLATSTINKTEFYRQNDRLVWKRNRRGPKGIKVSNRASSCRASPAGTIIANPSDGDEELHLEVKTNNIRLDDGFDWFKCGEKDIVNHKYPRSYLKCAQAGCRVRKRIQRSSDDEDYVLISYFGKHNHPRPDIPFRLFPRSIVVGIV